MNYILKIVKSFKDSGVLLKGVRDTIKNETKKQSVGFSSYVTRHIVLRLCDWYAIK